MALDLTVREETFAGNEDRRWAAHKKGFDTCKSGMLDVSAFSAAHFTAKGAIPSGTLLGKITATDKYGPYNGAITVDEVQTITRTATGGTFTLKVDGETTAAIDATAAVTAAVIQAAVNALSNVDEEHTVTVAGSAGGPFTLTFGGLWAGEDVPAIVVTDSGTGGTVTIAQTTAGASDSTGLGTFAGILFNTTPVGSAGDGSDFATAADVAVPIMREGIINQNYLPVFAGTTAGEVDAAARAANSNFIWEGTDL